MRRAILALVLFASYAYFYEAGGWNQNSRFDLTRALVEQHRVEIDAYHTNTGDKSVMDGHYYADKAPGSSFTAVPAVAAARVVFQLMGVAPESRDAVIWLSYVATVTAASIPGVAAGLFVFALARRAGARESRAAIVTLIFGLGTPYWAYATLMWGHALAAACLAGGLYFADRLRDPATPKSDRWLGASIGLLCGWAVVTEYPAAVPAVMIAALAGLFAGRERLMRVGVPLVAAASICAALLMTYQWAAFGSPFRIGYEHLEESTLMSAGLFGITVPKLDVMSELLFGSYRGLLPLAPVLAIAPFGWWMARRSAMKRTHVVAAAAVLFYFLMNAAYAHWEGGWSFGPRHLGTVIPFLALGLVLPMERGDAVVRTVIVTLGLFGIATALAAVSTTSQPPSETLMNPMQALIWPQFFGGQLATNHQSILDALWPANGQPAAWNLGQKAGLSGLASLAPLLATYVIAAVCWRKAAK